MTLPVKSKTNHIHKFKRHTYQTGNSVFFCTLDNCNFKIGVEFSIGKTNICNRCGNPFEMNSYAIRLAKPHCPDCHKAKSETGAKEYVNKNAKEIINDEALIKYETITDDSQDYEL